MRGKYSITVDGECYRGFSSNEAMEWIGLFQGNKNPFPRAKTMMLQRWVNDPRHEDDAKPCTNVECMNLHSRLAGTRIFTSQDQR